MEADLKARLRKIKILLLDVDGVLTDGGLYYSEDGDEMKKFFVRDGLGIKLVQQTGVQVGFITGMQSKLVSRRAKSLKIDEVIQGCMVKEPVVEALIRRKGLAWDQVAYIGDDLIDVGVMRLVGFAAAVKDAAEPTKKVAHYVTKHPGGQGAVREVCDLLMQARQ
jgi:3-deoxy-D-manno-octulosonate 8-phosphate phosphatase (KDO 8-P phosphatase)